MCYGLWLGPEIAKDHGVFVSTRENPTELKCMLQKPSVETLSSLLADHFYLTDIGVWILSDRAVKVLMQHSSAIGKELDGDVINYDMYGEFGCALGSEPVIKDAAVNDLKVAILPLPGGEFYHFGTSHELLSSMLAIQNLVSDQREIMHHDRKPHPSMFVQNTDVKIKWNENNRNIWVENAFIGAGWTLTKENIVTGVPENNWTLTLSEGQCVDVVPIGENQWAVRPYGFNDKFRGDLAEVEYLGGSFAEWAKERGVCIDDIEGRHDLQAARIFPIVSNVDDMGIVLRWMLSDPSLEEGKTIWAASRRVSADEISSEANLCRLVAQRTKFRCQNLTFLAKNWEHSVFYQTDLESTARDYGRYDIPLPSPLPSSASLLTRTKDAMFRSEALRFAGKDGGVLTLASGSHGRSSARTPMPASFCICRPDSLGTFSRPHRHCRWLDRHASLLPHGRRQCGQSCHQAERSTAAPDLRQAMQRASYRSAEHRPRRIRNHLHIRGVGCIQ